MTSLPHATLWGVVRAPVQGVHARARRVACGAASGLTFAAVLLLNSGSAAGTPGDPGLLFGLRAGYLLAAEHGFLLSPGLEGALRGAAGVERLFTNGFSLGTDLDVYYRRESPEYLLPPTTYTLSYVPVMLVVGWRKAAPGAKGAHTARIGVGVGQARLTMDERGVATEGVKEWLPCLCLQAGVRRSWLDVRLEYRFVRPLEGTLVLDQTWPQEIDEDFSGVSLLVGVALSRR
jgi:hypothetical protein